MTGKQITLSGVFCLFIGTAVGIGHTHEAVPHAHDAGQSVQESPQAPNRISMEELHRQGGVPQGWKFSFPVGDPKAGRAVFAKLECYQCHAIQEDSSAHSHTSATGVGPELTGMGSRHPAEYLAESILNPNAIIVTGPGYTDASGLSIMPDYRESLSVAELIDLVAYLKHLEGEHAHGGSASHPANHTGHHILFDQVVGNYRIHMAYHTATEEAYAHDGHRHASHSKKTAKAHGQDHLMAFITDAGTGEAVPYLPVTLTIPTPKQEARTVKLIPTLGDRGFYYGADIILPRQPTTVTLSIGATTMRLMPSIAGRFSTPQDVNFDWTPPHQATPVRERPLPHGHGTHDIPKSR